MAIICEKDEEGISREIKNYPQPADYLFKVESFSLLKKNCIERIESKTFQTGGHHWKIVIYPNGRDGSDGDYVSVNLRLASKNRKEVNAIFRFFLFDQIRDWCLLVEGRSKRFDWVKNEWGYNNFITTDDFKEPTSGYLVDDTCLFGVEIFVSQSSGLRECLSISNIDDTAYNYTWNIKRFSKLKEDCHSDEFFVGGYKWELWLFPEGDSHHKGSSLSVFLVLLDTPNNSGDEKVKVQFALRLKDRILKNHLQKTDTLWFSSDAASNVWGWDSFVQLEELKDSAKGFIVDDCCMIEAELTLLCATRRKSLGC